MVAVDQQKIEIEQLNPLNLQQHILQLARLYQHQDKLWTAILQFIHQLTNARACLFLEQGRQNNVQIQHQLLPAAWQEKDFFLTKAKEQARETWKSKETKITLLQKTPLPWYLINVPLFIDKEAPKNIAISLELDSQQEVEPFLLLTQLVAHYLPFIRSLQKVDQSNEIAKNAACFLEILEKGLAQNTRSQAAYEIARSLQDYLKCQRVVVLKAKNYRAKMLALSDTKKFDQRSNMIKVMEKAGSETLREGQEIIFSPSQAQEQKFAPLRSAHEELCELTQGEWVMSLPLYTPHDKEIGVWLFIWPQQHQPSDQQQNLLRAASPHVGTLLYHWQKFPRVLSPLFLPAVKKLLWPVVAAIAIISVLLLPWPYRVEAPSQLLPQTRRVVSAPFSGVLEQVHVKQGDEVGKGEVLASLDEKEARIELSYLKESLAGATKEAEIRFSKKEMAQYQQAMLEVKKIQEEIKLVQYQLAHLQIRSPLTGKVIQGDNEKLLGMTVSQGELLFEIASLEHLQVEMEIPESEIRFINKGMPATLVINSYPGKEWQLQVVSLRPMSEVRENQNVFIAEASLSNQQGMFWPGMKGKAFINVGEKTLAWIWFHRPFYWLQREIGW